MKRQRNILIFHCDQMRFDALGVNGHPGNPTPNLDRLAASPGTANFTRHIVANPGCMPSRASFFTGLYGAGHGVWTNGVPLPRREYAMANHDMESWAHVDVTPEPATMGDLFGAAGYATAAIGKVHLQPGIGLPGRHVPEATEWWQSGKGRDWRGPYYGFQYAELTHGHGENVAKLGHYADWLAREHPDVLRQLPTQGPRPVAGLNELYLSAIPSELHSSAWVADRTIRWLEQRDASKPFLLFAGFSDPHHPFNPPADAYAAFADAPYLPEQDRQGLAVRGNPGLAQEPFDCRHFSETDVAWVRRTTACMTHLIDRAVGRVLAALDRLKLSDDTIIIFTSDHGDFLCDHGLLRKSHFPSDVLLRVPFLLRVPGRDLPKTVARPMSNTDVLPTLAKLCNVPVTPQIQSHGHDALAGDEYPVMMTASTGFPRSQNLTVYDGRYRYSEFPVAGYRELVDHANDPFETRNILAGNPDVAARLRRQLADKLLQTWQSNTGCLSAW